MDIINDYYNEVICSINEGVIVTDKEDIIKFINNAAEKMLMVNAENSIGKYILNIFPHSELLSVIENGEVQINKEEGKFIVTRKVITQNDEVIGGLEIFNEKSESKLLIDSQYEGKVSEDVLNTIFNTVDECVVVVDENGIITMMSNGYKEFINCENPEGKHVTEVIENTKLHIVAKSGEKEFGEIQEANGHKMISMRVPYSERW